MSAVVFDLSLGEKTIHKDWVFKDLRTSEFTNDKKNRNIKIALNVDAIQNSLNNIFLFKTGERIINPLFGNNLYKYLYESVNEITAQKIGKALLDMMEKWEPRIEITSIQIIPYPDENTFSVKVLYNIPSMGNTTLAFNMAINQRR
jgi:phage baseplate assembly protein W